MGSSEYARPELLAEPDWVWEHRSESSVRVVDCGPEAAHWRAHVPEPSVCQSTLAEGLSRRQVRHRPRRLR